jgi:hypothetical protein
MTRATGRHMRLVLLAAAIIAALAISACGGSGSSTGSNGSSWSTAQKDKLKSELSSELEIGKVSGTLKSDVTAVKDCVVRELTTKYSPNAKPSTTAVNKVLENGCGQQLKAFEKAAKSAEAKSEKKTLSSSGN